MIKNLKEIIIFFIVIIAVSASVWSFVLRKSGIKERILQEDALFKENIVNKKAQERLSRLQDEAEGLQKSIANLTAKSASLESEILSYRQELEIAKRNISKFNSQNSSVKAEIERGNKNIDSLQNRIAQLIKESLKVNESLELLLKTKDALSRQVDEYIHLQSEQVRPVVERPDFYKDREEPALQVISDEPYSIAGEVLTVNREFAFLVVNIGKSSGIEEGMILNIKRDNKNLAQVRVETVREHISAAALVDKENLLQIRAGDKAVLMGSI
jgi:prefoldin subunit 5